MCYLTLSPSSLSPQSAKEKPVAGAGSTIHPNATAKTSVVGEHCPHCQRPLIEIDCYGERLIGCI